MKLGLIGYCLRALPRGIVTGAGDAAMRFYHESQIELRRRKIKSLTPLNLESYDGERLQRSIQARKPAWAAVRRTAKDTIPGMISREEAQYYEYISKFYSGRGEAVELGPWLGRSTFRITSGLCSNPLFKNHKLHVFDDFVWRADWMDPYVPAEKRLPQHADFYHLFQEYTLPIKDNLQVSKCRFAPYDGNEAVPVFSWPNGKKIEMLFVDCGRTLDGNNAWYDLVKKHLIPNRTLILLQDWGTHREVPVRCINQMHVFTGLLANELEIIHELRDGTLAGFLFCG
jgi:hypothetical protein